MAFYVCVGICHFYTISPPPPQSDRVYLFGKEAMEDNGGSLGFCLFVCCFYHEFMITPGLSV